MAKIFGRCAAMIRNWKVLVKTDARDLDGWAAELECRSARPPRISWEPLQEDILNANSEEGSCPAPERGPVYVDVSFSDVTCDEEANVLPDVSVLPDMAHGTELRNVGFE
jgi:hypothetical protein